MEYSCHVKQHLNEDRADVNTPYPLLHQLTRTTILSSCFWLLTIGVMGPAYSGEGDPPKPHSLIHRPDAPQLPVVPRPESTTRPSKPVATVLPSVTASTSQTLHHKLTKKPAATVIAPVASEPGPLPATSSRLSSAGNFPTPLPSTSSNSPSKSIPAPAGDRPILPIATRPLNMSSLSNAASPAASRSLAAGVQSTAAALSGVPGSSLAPSMSRLVQMSPNLAVLLQPSAPVVTPSSTTPPSATPPSPPPASPPSTPPPAPSTGSVTLSWSANGESDLAGYKIYLGTSSGNYSAQGSPTVIGKVTSYVLTGLQANTTYFFALSAYDNAGNESGLSAEVSRSIP